MTTAEVQSLYERRPYPHYPLLAKPRWQDGYLGSSLFAGIIAHEYSNSDQPRSMLSVGCGEILPYIIRKWEARQTSITCVDLSERSLQRARFRCLFTGGQMRFICADINDLLNSASDRQKKFDHIEAYGVLHHIPQLDHTIHLLSRHLVEHGTMRVMVYNAKARDWIWQLNRVFRLMNLRYDHDRDVQAAREFLFALAQHSPRLTQHLANMGLKSLQNDTRFADTFLHPWEARLGIEQWLRQFTKNDLEPFALYDRYGELDDLANPLWKMPRLDQLTERARDFRFENNLEIWLRHRGASQNQKREKMNTSVTAHTPFGLKLRAPPSQWTNFPETKTLSLSLKYSLWRIWVDGLNGALSKDSIKIIQSIPRAQAQRLARIGAILPQHADAASRYQELESPMTESVSVPIMPIGIDLSRLSSILSKYLEETKCSRVRNVILRRLERL